MPDLASATTRDAVAAARRFGQDLRYSDGRELLRAVFRNYERLPADLQSELPLKRVWALVPSRLES